VGTLPTPGGDDLVVTATSDTVTLGFQAMLEGNDGDRVTNVAEIVTSGEVTDLARADTLILVPTSAALSAFSGALSLPAGMLASIAGFGLLLAGAALAGRRRRRD
jgi:hypothetical protein